MTQAKLTTKIEYVEVPGVMETFADSVHTMVYDGQTFRVEFCVTRMDERSKDGGPLVGRRLTTCRMVLSPSAAAELSAKLGGMLSAMVKRAAPAQDAVQRVGSG